MVKCKGLQIMHVRLGNRKEGRAVSILIHACGKMVIGGKFEDHSQGGTRQGIEQGSGLGDLGRGELSRTSSWIRMEQHGMRLWDIRDQMLNHNKQHGEVVPRNDFAYRHSSRKRISYSVVRQVSSISDGKTILVDVLTSGPS